MAAEAMRRRWRRAGFVAVSLFGLGLALVAVAHTKLGRPLLSLLSSAPGCPVTVNASPALVETYRAEQLARRQGTRLPRSRPALGFELGKTTRAELVAWVERRGRCSAVREGQALQCRSVKPEHTSEPTIADLYAQFDASGRLVALDLFRDATDRRTALQVLTETAQRLEAAVGPSTAHTGAAPDTLRRPMSRVGAEYRYAGYVARMSATHLGKLGIRVREQYQSGASDT